MDKVPTAETNVNTTISPEGHQMVELNFSNGTTLRCPLLNEDELDWSE